MDSAGTGSPLVDSSEPRPLRRRLALTVAAGLALSPFLASCSGFFVKPTISSVYVTPAAATLGVGQNTPLLAYATYSDGTQNQLSGDSVGWTSSDTTIATVTSPGGSVTGVAIGSATITATAQGVSGTATVTVTVANITSLVINTTQGSTTNQTTATISGAPNTLQFYAYANGSANNDVTNAVNWTSSNTQVASISTGLTSGSGLATSVAPGTTNITATTTNSATGQKVTSQTIVLTVQ